ncbi:hypothetical protein HN51_001629 [Arachis hypogaea]
MDAALFSSSPRPTTSAQLHHTSSQSPSKLVRRCSRSASLPLFSSASLFSPSLSSPARLSSLRSLVSARLSVIVFLLTEIGEEVKAIVPKSVLKKQKREEEWALKKKEEFNAAKKKRVESRKLIYSRAKQYAKEYQEQVKDCASKERSCMLAARILAKKPSCPSSITCRASFTVVPLPL